MEKVLARQGYWLRKCRARIKELEAKIKHRFSPTNQEMTATELELTDTNIKLRDELEQSMTRQKEIRSELKKRGMKISELEATIKDHESIVTSESPIISELIKTNLNLRDELEKSTTLQTEIIGKLRSAILDLKQLKNDYDELKNKTSLAEKNNTMDSTLKGRNQPNGCQDDTPMGIKRCMAESPPEGKKTKKKRRRKK
jgi:uncharacterized protein with GYD domain